MPIRFSPLALLLILACGCGESVVVDAGPGHDAGQADATAQDAARADTVQVADAAQPDAWQADTSQPDAWQDDAWQADAAQADAWQEDAALAYNILDGEGVGSIRVSESTFADVEAAYGSDFVRTEPYAVIMTYEGLGLAFARRASESTVRLVSFFAPFAGVTKRGIVLNQSTMRDVQAAYGPLDWRSTTSGPLWWTEYQGIQFYVERDLSVPQFPFDEALHIDRTIVRISVGNNSF